MKSPRKLSHSVETNVHDAEAVRALELRVNPRVSTHRSAKGFGLDGRVQIPDFLEKSVADRIFQYLTTETQWVLIFNRDGKRTDLDMETVNRMSPEKQRQLAHSIHRNARDQFQYLYKSFPMHEQYLNNKGKYAFTDTICEFLNSPDFLTFGKEVTGRNDIEFADAQATLYAPGHFLTTHDDNVSGENRCAAYIISFTPNWNPDWGGNLVFHDHVGNIEGAFRPLYNSISFIRIGQNHAVSYVAPFASAPRVSITGWLRHR